ncbi:MAG: PP2C family protein-serine/threonine phosphatase [Melioribacter sp.]|uniref:PP2C family protein-serine/threonine phosphatase n=1 Tax=Rosettibacter primus TaxID=3111523 RepID=UPI00247DEA49|nr:PP2C family protein-serine/threonine phosphatase [Melioribacter sp.]
MDQKKLFKTIDTIASGNFNEDAELLKYVIDQIVSKEQFNVSGGRVWKLEPSIQAYRLLFQTGKVQKIPKDYKLFIKDYVIFDKISSVRTILADETDATLIAKGIFKYSASGVGKKININGKKYYEYLIAINSDQIGDDLRYTLNVIATVLTSKLRERYLTLSRNNLIENIDKAKELQRSILPEHEYKFHFYDIFGVTIPAENVAGDFYDYLKIGDDEERLGIVVGDAASKGLAAAAEAMYISGAIRMASNFQIKISPMMFRLNQLVNKIFSDDKFVSLFYGEISTDKKGLFLYANAGQNPPIFYSKKNNSFTYLHPTGPLLGPAPNSKYETDSINFHKGDILVIYSDGVVESANDKYEFYDEKRLEKIIKKTANFTPKEIVYSILDDVTKFTTSDSKYQDDKTLVVIKRND